jgi:hypothetical protein
MRTLGVSPLFVPARIIVVTPIVSGARAISFALTTIAAQTPTEIGDVAGATIGVECGPVPAAVGAATVGNQSVAVHPDISATVQIGSLWRPLGVRRLSADCGGEQQRHGRTDCRFHMHLLLMSVICNGRSQLSVPAEARPLASDTDTS